jgi:hypothetical protein
MAMPESNEPRELDAPAPERAEGRDLGRTILFAILAVVAGVAIGLRVARWVPAHWGRPSPDVEAERQRQRAHLRYIGKAVAEYRLAHGGACPPDLFVLVEGRYLEDDVLPGEEFAEVFGHRRLHYVRPGAEDPDAILLFFWPPHDGLAEVMRRDMTVDTLDVNAERDRIQEAALDGLEAPGAEEPDGKATEREGTDQAEATAGEE